VLLYSEKPDTDKHSHTHTHTHCYKLLVSRGRRGNIEVMIKFGVIVVARDNMSQSNAKER